ncbi:cytochrome c oxidase subunit 3 [Streptomyces qinglanensis]|uniref:cytochrome c oxidase subunit 3 n=1 Tax=Streptomyces qinglanensis TaxID=943816 RepID=UPI000B192D0A|nr:cytochrome c oxidase subunit 3 [Streptomyces qinglanensis]
MPHDGNGTSLVAEEAQQAPAPHQRTETDRTAPWLPGEVGIWVFVLTDLMMFTAYFAAVMNERGHHGRDFVAGRAAMNTDLGVVNTFLMLTASLCIALAVHAVRKSEHHTSRRFLLAAGTCGALFIVAKAIEWSSAVGAGHTPQTNVFFQMYFLLTGMHLLHVIIAMLVLAHMWHTTGRGTAPTGTRRLRFFENGATFWHLTDTLWIVLFTLFYLVR